ncbi:MAG: hypothetical protein ACLS5A_03980 [Pseudoruminococcus massiliensis]
MDYTTTADCKKKTPLTNEEKQQIIDYFKDFREFIEERFIKRN